MTRFMIALTAAALCGPFAAQAAVMPSPQSINASTVPAVNSDASQQVVYLTRQVMALNGKVWALEQQTAPGTAYVAELSGIIPTGG